MKRIQCVCLDQTVHFDRRIDLKRNKQGPDWRTHHQVVNGRQQYSGYPCGTYLA